MLKIKDNVNLKELEKFGLRYTEETEKDCESYILEYEEDSNYYYLFINFFSREIYGNNHDLLYDLIQAGLVM